MGTAMFYSSIYNILLIVIHSSKNNTENVDGFAVIFDGIRLSPVDGKQFSNLIILYMVEVW